MTDAPAEKLDLYLRLGSQFAADRESGPTGSTLTHKEETADNDRAHSVLVAVGLPAG